MDRRCAEAEDYSLIAMANENSRLYLECDEKIFQKFQDLVSNPTDEHLIEAFAALKGSLECLVRMTIDADKLLHVFHLENDWKEKNAHFSTLC